MPVQVQVEDVGPCRKLLKIEIPKERVTEELEKTYRQLNDNIVVPGFRRGHVPRWLMQSRFGKQVNDDTKDSLVADSFDEAVKEKELRPIGTPKFDEEIAFAPDQPLAFGVTIEVRPEFDIEGYAGLELDKASAEPTKAEIDQRIEIIRRRYAKLEDVHDGSPKPEDVVTCRVVLRDADHPYRDVPKHQFIVGDHVLVGLNLDQTTEFLTSTALGKTVEKKVTLPDDYQDEAKRGAPMTLALTLDAIRRPVLPDLTDQWAKDAGFESLAAFRDEVKSAVLREKDQKAREELEAQLDEQLLKKADFDLPENMLTTLTERLVLRRGLLLRYQGLAPEQIEQRVESLRAESRESAQKAAKLYFILEKIADKERLFVTEDAVNARVEAIAANYNRSPDQVLREFEKDDGLAELRSSMRDEKVRTFLLEKAAVKELKAAAKKTAKADE